MRRIAILVTFVTASLPGWVTPAGATHEPCDPSGLMCTRVVCPRGSGDAWFWLDHHGFPRVDLTHCPGIQS